MFGAEATLWSDVVAGLVYAPGYTIMGGTSNIMRNILGERVLGLPASHARSSRADGDHPEGRDGQAEADAAVDGSTVRGPGPSPAPTVLAGYMDVMTATSDSRPSLVATR